MSPSKNQESKVEFEIRRLESEQRKEEALMAANKDLYLKRRLEKKYDELKGLSVDDTKNYMKAYDKFMTTRGMQNKNEPKVKKVEISQ